MTSLTRKLSLGTVIAALAFAAPTLAQTPPPSPPAAAEQAPQASTPPAPPMRSERAVTPIAGLQSTDGITISGRVADIFGNKFVLEDGSGRVLVETGPQRAGQIEVREGEELQVIGEPKNGSFDAFTIVRADGSRTEIRPADGPPPWAGGRDRADRDERRGPRGERAGPRGEERRAGLGEARRSDERGPRRIDAADELPRAEIMTILETAGYTRIDDFDRKGRHWEVEARNRFDEEVEVHIDFGGNIYKEERE